MAWHPTPKHLLITARRLDPTSGEWRECEYADLKIGDIYKAFAGDTHIDTEDLQPTDDEDLCAYCCADAERGRPPFNPKRQGWMVEIIAGKFADLMKMVTH